MVRDRSHSPVVQRRIGRMARPGKSDLLESDTQADLFGEANASPKAYVPDPRHVRNRLTEMLSVMRSSESWPWEPVTVALYRETVWPYLCDKLPDPEEAARFRAEIEAEIARLDAAA
jgi:hypothetical protein